MPLWHSLDSRHRAKKDWLLLRLQCSWIFFLQKQGKEVRAEAWFDLASSSVIIASQSQAMTNCEAWMFRWRFTARKWRENMLNHQVLTSWSSAAFPLPSPLFRLGLHFSFPCLMKSKQKRACWHMICKTLKNMIAQEYCNNWFNNAITTLKYRIEEMLTM